MGVQTPLVLINDLHRPKAAPYEPMKGRLSCSVMGQLGMNDSQDLFMGASGRLGYGSLGLRLKQDKMNPIAIQWTLSGKYLDLEVQWITLHWRF